MADRQIPETTVAERFSKLLSAHGFGFQSAILYACEGKKSFAGGVLGTWQLMATEVPVSLNEREFHIDGVLAYRSGFHQGQRLAAVECKRADRSVKDWCFIRTAGPALPMVFDRFLISDVSSSDGPLLTATAVSTQIDVRNYDLGFEVKGDTKAECPDVGKGLSDALTQVMRAAGGLAEHYRSVSWTIPSRGAASVPPEPYMVFPLIVTTAQLHVADAPLDRSVNVADGRLFPGLATKPASWVWFTTNRNRSQRPRVQRQWKHGPTRQNPIGYHLAQEATRSILISSVDGLDDALNQLANVEPNA